MNEHKFRWPVLLIVGGLLDADLREVPHINATVTGCRRENRGAMGRPCEVQYLVRVSLKRVQRLPQSFDVMQQDCLFGPLSSCSRIHADYCPRTLSALPVIKRVSAPGLKATASISWSCACRDDVGAFCRVSQLRGFIYLYIENLRMV